MSDKARNKKETLFTATKIQAHQDALVLANELFRMPGLPARDVRDWLDVIKDRLRGLNYGIGVLEGLAIGKEPPKKEEK